MNDRRLTEEAATWYLDMQDAPDARTQAQFMRWLRRSPEHVAEYLAMAQMHGDLRAATAAEEMSLEELRELAGSESAVVALRAGVLGEHPSPMNRLPQGGADAVGGSRFIGDARPRQRRTRVLRWTAAAATVLLACGSLTATWPSPAEPGIRYAAGIDVREVTLDDDTVVQLSPQSAMVVRFDTAARHIELVQGSASFDIGKDAARPMKVTVGRQQIDDVGTVFDVQRSDGAAQVTVVSGQVSVWNLPSPWLARARARLTGTPAPRDRLVDLRGGETARVDADGHVTGHGQANVVATTQWLPEDIRFHDATVAEVARRFNAYSTKPLVVDDPELARKRISGVFHARDPEAFIAYVDSLPHVRVDRMTDRVRFSTTHHATQL
ncbi:FecR family protein [Luteibacter sp. OK325]|uniref:FecR family protein n=1 Tax=Luteibacter sp. OK325 TaxID=2135670 RepID=UPI000D34E4EF|nr:FecR domain-containing protein [Luteibacter sp. OK325]PTR33895.1 FecR family protein [Luteibacter sp. OK325]